MTYFECLTKLSFYINEVLKNCEEKNWEALSNNEKQRELFIQKLKTLTPDNSKETIDLLRKTLSLNNLAIDAANNNKMESETALLKSKRNVKKTAQYL